MSFQNGSVSVVAGLYDADFFGFRTTKCKNGIADTNSHRVSSGKSFSVNHYFFTWQETKFLQPCLHKKSLLIIGKADNDCRIAFFELSQIVYRRINRGGQVF